MMANAIHLTELRNGAEVWNTWVEQQGHEFFAILIEANLRGADLSDANLIRAHLNDAHLNDASLIRANLRYANLRYSQLIRADLSRANLERADLSSADLGESMLGGANLSGAKLRGAHLIRADLIGADLESADLTGAEFIGANLCRANLRRANLGNATLNGADLRDANLSSANLSGAYLDKTGLANTDLSDAKGLNEITHGGPSSIDHQTIQKTTPPLSLAFLRGCGLSDWAIESAKLYRANLTAQEVSDIAYEIVRLRGDSPIQVNPVFISYSRDDDAFVTRIEQEFNAEGVRFWRDVHDMGAGRLDLQVERAIALNPTVFLVLSEHSVESDWVEWEAEKARDLEKILKRDVLCPVTLDNAWKTSDWDPTLRKQIQKYNILDFSNWQNESFFDTQYEKLRKGLGLYYRSEKAITE